MQDILSSIRINNHNKFTTKFSKKRNDSRDLYRVYATRLKELKESGFNVTRPGTEILLGENFPVSASKSMGKMYLRLIRSELQKILGVTVNLIQKSQYITDPSLENIKPSHGAIRRIKSTTTN